MKLRQRPHKSPVGVKFKFSEEHSLWLFHMEAPPGFQMSNGNSWSDGATDPQLQLGKYIFQVKNDL